MNREIKFRAYDIAKKEWLFGYEMPHLGGFSLFGEIMLMGEWATVLDNYIFERNGHKQDDLKVMQYTGLKDKNGKEIYEGDIIKFIKLIPIGTIGLNPSLPELIEKLNTAEKKEWICKVEYFGSHFYVSGRNGGLDLTTANASRTLEVIGNIYENSELLN